MIKVLQFIHGLNTGGAETLVKNYALGLDKSRFDVTVLCLNHVPDSPYEKVLRENGIKLFFVSDSMPHFGRRELWYRFWNHYAIYFKVRKYIQKIKPDVIHVHLILNKYVRFAHPTNKTKIVYTQHFDVKWLKLENQSEINCILWEMENYPVHLIALNRKMKSQMDEMFHTQNTVIINNGIDFKQYEKPFDRKKKRYELGIPENALAIVHVGRFDPLKNHPFLVRVFAEIKKRRKDAFLVMVGVGSEEFDIVQQLKKEGLNNDYLILHNRLDVPEILRTCDAALFPSISEGLGMAVVEMQAAGLPVLASKGVPPDAKISNLLNFMSIEESPGKWATKLLKMIDLHEPVKYYNKSNWDIREAIKQLENIYSN